MLSKGFEKPERLPDNCELGCCEEAHTHANSMWDRFNNYYDQEIAKKDKAYRECWVLCTMKDKEINRLEGKIRAYQCRRDDWVNAINEQGKEIEELRERANRYEAQLVVTLKDILLLKRS